MVVVFHKELKRLQLELTTPEEHQKLEAVIFGGEVLCMLAQMWMRMCWKVEYFCTDMVSAIFEIAMAILTWLLEPPYRTGEVVEHLHVMTF